MINDRGDRVPQPDLCLVIVLQRQMVFHCSPNSSVFITGRMKPLIVPDKNDSEQHIDLKIRTKSRAINHTLREKYL